MAAPDLVQSTITPRIRRRQDISKTFSLFSSSFLVVQVSAPYNKIERISDW